MQSWRAAARRGDEPCVVGAKYVRLGCLVLQAHRTKRLLAASC